MVWERGGMRKNKIINRRGTPVFDLFQVLRPRKVAPFSFRKGKTKKKGRRGGSGMDGWIRWWARSLKSS